MGLLFRFEFARFLNGQVIVFGKVENKVEGAWVEFMQSGIDYDALDLRYLNRPCIGRIGKARIGMIARRPK